MKPYLDLVKRVIETGTRQSNRTGIDTLFIPGSMLHFNMSDGFPAVTTKRLAFKSVVGELLGFLRGCDSAEQFRALGSTVWDANANENGVRPNPWLSNANRKGKDDLGRIYGVQWRNWRGKPHIVDVNPVSRDADNMNFMAEIEYTPVDQLANVLNTLYTNPTDRRMIINGWRPDEFGQMALPPCHILYQFVADVSNNKLHLCMYQRSADLGLGVPFNIASCALFLHIMSALTGFKPGVFTHFMADVHVYVNHIEELKIQLERPLKPLPQLVYNGPAVGITDNATIDRSTPILVGFDSSVFDTLMPSHFSLKGYEYSAGSKMEMAT